jgi:hypothetical protein
MGTHGEQVRTSYEQYGEQFGNIIRNLLLNRNTKEHKLATHELEKETPHPPSPFHQSSSPTKHPSHSPKGLTPMA